jgi:hypothetical protein
MRVFRSMSILSLLVCAAFAMLTVVGKADSKKAEGQALLEKAEQASRLNAGGSPPFLFEATLDLVEGRAKKTANFYLLWQDTESWRAMAVEGNHREIHIRNPKGLWLPKLPDIALVPVFRYGMAFPFQKALVSWNGKIVDVRNRTIKNAKLRCVRFRAGVNAGMVEENESEACVDSVTGSVQRVTLQSLTATNDAGVRRAIGSSMTVVEYGDYAKFGEKWVPFEIRWTVDGGVEADLRVVQLRANPEAASDLFAGPPQYDVWPYCENYTTVHMDEILFPGSIDPRSPGADAFYVVVGADGKAREVRLINPTGRSTKQWVGYFMKQHYEPATCNGDPVLGYFLMGLPLR